MSSRKTLLPASTDSGLLKPDNETTTPTKKKVFRTTTRGHVLEALTLYLRSISMIDDNEYVDHIKGVENDKFEIKILETHND